MIQTSQGRQLKQLWWKMDPNCPSCKEIWLYRLSNPQIRIENPDKILLDYNNQTLIRHPHIESQRPLEMRTRA